MTNKKILFLSLSFFSFGFLFFVTDSAEAASCAFVCSDAEEQVSEMNCMACATDMLCCERKTQYAQCDPDPGKNVSTDGKSCTIGSKAGKCQNGVCKEAASTGSKLTNGMICSSDSECVSGFCDSAQAVCDDKKPAGGGTTPPPPGGGGAATGGWSLNSVSKFGLPNGSVLGIISGILVWLLSALGILGVIGFVISGILYLTSTGDETMIDRAKDAMKYSIMGVIVGLLGVVIIQAIDWMLRGYSNF